VEKLIIQTAHIAEGHDLALFHGEKRKKERKNATHQRQRKKCEKMLTESG